MVLISQRKIHRMAQSENWDERREAAKLFGSNFEVLPDKEQAWIDLHRLTLDKVPDVRMDAARAVGIAFPNIPNKKLAWKDIHRLTQVKEEYVREYAALALGYAFSHIPDKEQAWNDLQRLVQDEEPEVLESVSMSLNAAFTDISDKEQAWEYLLQLAQYNNYDVLFAAIDALGDVYSDILDKEQAWEDIFWLTRWGEDIGRWRAVYALGAAFPHNPNKQKAWNDIHLLTLDKCKDILGSSAYVLGVIFPHTPYKEQAWADLHRLTLNEENYVRNNAARAIGLAFPCILDKEPALADLHRLTEDLDSHVRFGAAVALGSVFPHIPEKEQAWKDITRLLQDDTSYVQSAAVITLGIVFPHVLDKEQAWSILHCHIRDLRHDSAIAIGLAFSYIPDKEQACRDLIWLSQDKDKDVRGAANYSLGKAFIFKATEAESEEDFRKELEKALEFFEKSSRDTTYNNPAIFCLPFYRSYYIITFKKQDTKIEIQKYLIEAKIASEGSESRVTLLEAVENLGNALREAKGEQNFDEIKYNLNSYRRYCERAAELIETTEETAPGASKLIRKAFPIIDQRITDIIGEIQEKAKAICKKAKDTPLETLGLETNKKAKKLSQLNDFSLDFNFDWMTATVFKFCDYLPSDKKPEICGKISAAKNMDAIQKGEIIKETFDYILENIGFPRIKNIPISQKREKTTIRIAAAQLYFELMKDSFPPKLKDKDATRLKILSALDKAKKNKVDIICFPELCICEDWLSDIKIQYQDMIIIPGSYYDTENHNVCQLILDTPTETPPQLKISPSAFEDSEIMGTRMTPGEKLINIYETQFGNFAVLICRDFGNFVHSLKGIVDVIFVPSYNSSNVRFHKDADNHVTNSPSYIIISNTALYGGTSIFGQLNSAYFNTLEQGGCKEKGDKSYKLCEIEKDKEGMIIADFNLIQKSPQLQTAMNPDEEIKPVKNIVKIEL